VGGLPAATGEELMLDQQARYEASSLKGLKLGNISFVNRFTKGCKWPGHAGHGGPGKDSEIIEVGLALVLWNQELSNIRGQSAR
jgi:hypothetical protein